MDSLFIKDNLKMLFKDNIACSVYKQGDYIKRKLKTFCENYIIHVKLKRIVKLMFNKICSSVNSINLFIKSLSTSTSKKLIVLKCFYR